MKIQCPCGAKYSFDITPEMGRNPIQLVCQNCQQDISAAVNQVIRQQLGLDAAASAPRASETPPPSVATPPVRVAAPSASPVSAAAPIAPPATAAPALRVSSHAATQAAAAAPAVAGTEPCLKHVGQLTTHRCLVCQKPICPKCMELFGFLCSAYCKGKAEDKKLNIPAYEGLRDVSQSKLWRKVRLVATSIVSVIAIVLGVWFWYAWIASVPKVAFSLRFPEAGYSGQLGSSGQDQIVFLHAGTLARHDTKAKKEIWSTFLIDKKSIAEEAARTRESMIVARAKAIDNGADADDLKVPSVDELIAGMERSAADDMQLHLRGEGVWVAFSDRLVRFDYQTGKQMQEIPLKEEYGRLIPDGDELLLITDKSQSQKIITHFNLVSGESRTEEVGEPAPAPVAALSANKPRAANRTGTNQLPAGVRPGQNPSQPLDPAKLAAQYENLPKPAKLALPAVLAANANQQRLQAEMRDQQLKPAASPAPLESLEDDGRPRLIRTQDGFTLFSVKLLESKTVERKAMKDPPKKSAFDGPINSQATVAIANEIFNDMQRDRGDDVVVEDISRYQVTVRRAGDKASSGWTGEVTGSPALVPLKTVDAVLAGKSMVVLDKAGKKLWEAQFNFNLAANPYADDALEESEFGAGPGVERGDTLFVFDAGMLTSFDLATGNVRWRLPSVGIAGLFFDDKGAIYANTTTASPESIKYSRQIDISDKVHVLVLKVDPKTGRTLWTLENDGLVNYISGKFIYTTESHQADDEGEGMFGVKTGLEIPSHIRIKRIDPGNGRVLWQHYQKRMPLDLEFDKTTIRLLFRKEVLVLKYFSL